MAANLRVVGGQQLGDLGHERTLAASSTSLNSLLVERTWLTTSNSSLSATVPVAEQALIAG
jgi:hypothetical protein